MGHPSAKKTIATCLTLLCASFILFSYFGNASDFWIKWNLSNAPLISDSIYFQNIAIATLNTKVERKTKVFGAHYTADQKPIHATWGAFSRSGNRLLIQLQEGEETTPEADTISVYPFFYTFDYQAFRDVFKELEATNFLESSRVKYFFATDSTARREKIDLHGNGGFADCIYIQTRFSENHFRYLYTTRRLYELKAKSSFFASPNLSDVGGGINIDSINIPGIHFSGTDNCFQKWKNGHPPWVEIDKKFHSCIEISQMRCNLSSDTCAFYASVNPRPFQNNGWLYIIYRADSKWQLSQKLPL